MCLIGRGCEGLTVMEDVKGILQSKAVWGGLVALMAGGASIWGYTISPENQAHIVDLITGIAGAFGGLLAVYGRIAATKKVELGGGF